MSQANISEPSTIESSITWQWLKMESWRMIAFGFGSGLSRRAPGTIGTMWAWASALLFLEFGPDFGDWKIAIILSISFILGAWACGKTGADLNQPDHSGMVWDEIVAFWLILWFVLPCSWWQQLLAFGLFRFFDILKPGRIRWVDSFFKYWQPHSNYQQDWMIWIRGLGVMVDDLLAAFFTLLVMALFIRLGF